MEVRKLIQFGGNSYVISLPKKWIKLHSLEKGDPIYLDFDKDRIILNIEYDKNTNKG